MFMSHVDNDDIDTLFTPSKKTPKNPVKTAKKDSGKVMKKTAKASKKAAPKKAAKVVKAKTKKPKSKEAVIKFVTNPKKRKPMKPKTYKVSGSFVLDVDGSLLKHTKSISAVTIKDKCALVQLLIKTK